MRRYTTAFAAILAALLVVGLAGCQELFTTSLGKSLARDTYDIPSDLTPAEAAELAEEAQNDPKLAAALVDALNEEIKGESDPEVRAALEGSAASAAIAASGASDDIVAILPDVAAGDTPSADTLVDLVEKIKDSATPSIVTALSYLDPESPGGLTADQAKAAGLDATDLAVAALILAASAVPSGVDPDTIKDDPAALAAYQASPEVQAAQRILAEAQSMVEPGSDSAKMLDNLMSLFSL
jgi:hypothetical protein